MVPSEMPGVTECIVRREYGRAIGRPVEAVTTPALLLDLPAARRNIPRMAEGMAGFRRRCGRTSRATRARISLDCRPRPARRDSRPRPSGRRSSWPKRGSTISSSSTPWTGRRKSSVWPIWPASGASWSPSIAWRTPRPLPGGGPGRRHARRPGRDRHRDAALRARRCGRGGRAGGAARRVAGVLLMASPGMRVIAR